MELVVGAMVRSVGGKLGEVGKDEVSELWYVDWEGGLKVFYRRDGSLGVREGTEDWKRLSSEYGITGVVESPGLELRDWVRVRSHGGVEGVARERTSGMFSVRWPVAGGQCFVEKWYDESGEFAAWTETGDESYQIIAVLGDTGPVPAGRKVSEFTSVPGSEGVEVELRFWDIVLDFEGVLGVVVPVDGETEPDEEVFVKWIDGCSTAVTTRGGDPGEFWEGKRRSVLQVVGRVAWPELKLASYSGPGLYERLDGKMCFVYQEEGLLAEESAESRDLVGKTRQYRKKLKPVGWEDVSRALRVGE